MTGYLDRLVDVVHLDYVDRGIGGHGLELATLVDERREVFTEGANLGDLVNELFDVGLGQ